MLTLLTAVLLFLIITVLASLIDK